MNLTRRLLLAPVAALAIHPAWAAPTLVQKTHCDAQSVTSTTCALPTAVAPTDAVLIQVNTGGSIGTVSSTPTDSSGNTVSVAITFGNNSGNNGLGYYYVQNASSGTHTITVNYSAAVNTTIFLAEYSGVATSGAFDKASAIAFASSASITTASITPANSGELVIFAVQQLGSGNTYSSFTNSLTQQDSYNTNGPSGTWAAVVTGSSISGGVTSSSSGASAAAVAAFVPSGAPTGAAQSSLTVLGVGP